MSHICTHPDHNDQETCGDRAVGCSKHCVCCMGQIAVSGPSSPLTEDDFVDRFTGFVIPFNDLRWLIGYPMVQITGRFGNWEISNSEEDRLCNYVRLLRTERNMTVCDYD